MWAIYAVPCPDALKVQSHGNPLPQCVPFSLNSTHLQACSGKTKFKTILTLPLRLGLQLQSMPISPEG